MNLLDSEALKQMSQEITGQCVSVMEKMKGTLILSIQTLNAFYFTR